MALLFNIFIDHHFINYFLDKLIPAKHFTTHALVGVLSKVKKLQKRENIFGAYFGFLFNPILHTWIRGAFHTCDGTKGGQRKFFFQSATR